jgi:hypothetical protein
MAETDVTTLSDSESEQLAKRLEARATSVLLKDAPHLCADMAAAARAIRILLAIQREGNRGK